MDAKFGNFSRRATVIITEWISEPPKQTETVTALRHWTGGTA
jgi:hypothetical protein